MNNNFELHILFECLKKEPFLKLVVVSYILHTDYVPVSHVIPVNINGRQASIKMFNHFSDGEDATNLMWTVFVSKNGKAK